MTSDDPNRGAHRHHSPRSRGRGHSRRDTTSQHAGFVPGQHTDTDGGANSQHTGANSQHTGLDGGANSQRTGPDGVLDAAPPQQQPTRLSRDAQRHLQAARLWITANRPYYAKALFSCAVIPTIGSGRVGIDERWRIYANSEHLESLTVEQTAAELIHVLNHALRDHAQRARTTGVDTITSPLWHAAADCEINDDLHEDGLIDDDSGWLFPQTLDMDDLQLAERYYRHLLDHTAAVEAAVGCGSGCHSQHVAHERVDDTDALSDFDRKLLQRTTASEVAAHRKAHGTTSVPEGLARWAQQTLHPRVDWRQQLASALRTCVHHKTGTADYSWQRPSRRQQLQDPVLRPALTRPMPSIAMVVDTSGSMSSDELDRALTEIGAIIAAVVPGDSVRVLSVDTAIRADQRIHKTNQIQLQGTGGTDMAAGICAAAETGPDAIVVITDAWTPWPATRPAGARHVIAALTDTYQLHAIPTWIQAIDISE